jgi:hypothetical protein
MLYVCTMARSWRGLIVIGKLGQFGVLGIRAKSKT